MILRLVNLDLILINFLHSITAILHPKTEGLKIINLFRFFLSMFCLHFARTQSKLTAGNQCENEPQFFVSYKQFFEIRENLFLFIRFEEIWNIIFFANVNEQNKKIHKFFKFFK
jgi:hypothetical protein